MEDNGAFGSFLALCLAFVVLTVSVDAQDSSKVIKLDENSWTEMLKGEWMVEFYAPWCPACKALQPTWDKLASWSEDLNLNVASIDVTENPGLSGRFLVLALPTIFHVKDGSFRQYRGSREENELVSFVDDKKWLKAEEVSWYKHPASTHMSLLSMFFKLSMGVRELHTTMIEDYNIPWWASYSIFAVMTIIIGLILGLVLVFLCDCLCPPHAPIRKRKTLSDTRTDKDNRSQKKEAESNSFQDDDEDEVRDNANTIGVNEDDTAGTADTADTVGTGDTAGTADTVGTGDTAGTADTVGTGDTAETAGTGDTAETPKAADTETESSVRQRRTKQDSDLNNQ